MTQDAHFQDVRILVVEDDFFVALTVVEMLEDAGATVIGPINSVEEALTFIENDDNVEFDFAVIDINLRGRKSYPNADALAARNVKFMFATGYGVDAIDSTYSRFPRCEKPFVQDVLLQTARSCLNGNAADQVPLHAVPVDQHLNSKIT
jgi:two-component SAPR family response regulator